ncbi:hypothetical protein ACFC1I_20920 [Microbacterium sp. NPDC056044]|uniref:hypothetical protein n=1 Tax=Microbacterium sp. NPDC056044 TaxID=3345690 RepID=UPI0035DBE151
MTAPDPGLTDLLAAHKIQLFGVDGPHYQAETEYDGCLCGWQGAEEDHPAHVALVVEQHTNGQAAKLAEAVQGMWRLIRKLDETSDGLGDWHDATECIDWARKEVQEIYVRAALEGES